MYGRRGHRLGLLQSRTGPVELAEGHGQVFAFLGPNGAGKTTTIEILSGYRERSGGRVRPGHGPGPAHQCVAVGIGMVPQFGGPEHSYGPRDAR